MPSRAQDLEAQLRRLDCDWCGVSAAAPCRLGCTRTLPADGGYSVEVEEAGALTELDLGAVLEEALADWEAA